MVLFDFKNYIIMKFSPHFTYTELTHTYTHCVNIPSAAQLLNLKSLCLWVLEPLRTLLKMPIHINSGYRSPETNKAVGGVPNSLHLQGLAVDISTGLWSIEQIKMAVDFLKKQPVVDEIIQHSTYIHVGLISN